MKLLCITLMAIAVISMDDRTPDDKLKTATVRYGMFDGRTPCQELAEQLQEKKGPECVKIKWRLTLYQDSLTRNPAHYTLEGFVHKKGAPRQGNWHILTGTAEDPKAVVYMLEESQGKPAMFFQKGDDNVLFFLDAEKKLMVGNYDFSYALNRVK